MQTTWGKSTTPMPECSRPIRRFFLHPATLIVALLFLVGDALTLPNGPQHVSRAAVMIRGPWRGASHPYPLPIDIYRAADGSLVAVGRDGFPGAGSPPAGASLLDGVVVFDATLRSIGAWAPTTRTRSYMLIDDGAIAPAEHAALADAVSHRLRAMEWPRGADPLLNRGIFTASEPIPAGYAHNTLALFAAAIVLVASIMHASRGIRALAGANRRRRGLCPACGYDLKRRYIGGCPECGWGRAR